MVVFGGFGNDRHVFSPKVVVLFVHAFPRRLCDGRVARIHRAFFIVHLLETFVSASPASPDRRVLAPYVSREAFYQSWRAMSFRNSVR